MSVNRCQRSKSAKFGGVVSVWMWGMKWTAKATNIVGRFSSFGSSTSTCFLAFRPACRSKKKRTITPSHFGAENKAFCSLSCDYSTADGYHRASVIYRGSSSMRYGKQSRGWYKNIHPTIAGRVCVANANLYLHNINWVSWSQVKNVLDSCSYFLVVAVSYTHLTLPTIYSV